MPTVARSRVLDLELRESILFFDNILLGLKSRMKIWRASCL